MPSADDEMLSRLPTKELIDHAHVRYRKTIGLKGSVEFVDARNVIPHLIDTIEKQQRELEQAWTERNVAYAKVKAWEDVVYVEGLQMRSVRVDEWGPGEGEMTEVPDISPKKLTELLDRLAKAESQTVSIRQIDLGKGEGFPE